jgi:glyoxylase-like metal-dependent hydrolase (beta-lactamase superfamily II)
MAAGDSGLARSCARTTPVAAAWVARSTSDVSPVPVPRRDRDRGPATATAPHPASAGVPTGEGDGALSVAAQVGIHAIEVPTPFAVGAVNAYLIEDDPLTLIDTGPNSGTSLEGLEDGLRELGHAIDDLGLIVITHQHMDHLGLADLLARRSGAEVAAIDVLVPWAADWAQSMEADDAYADAMMARYGVPDDVRIALRALTASFHGWGAPVNVTRPLTDRGTLELRDRTLHVLHRPGHSPSDTVLYDEQEHILLAGDHLIKHISSNPLLTRPLGHDGGGEDRPRTLVTYMESLRCTQAMDVDLVLSGHGAPFADHAVLIDERFQSYRRRADRLLELIREQPRTAFELASVVFGNVAVARAYLTVSSILGHTDLLVDDGLVVEAVGSAGVVTFELTD